MSHSRCIAAKRAHRAALQKRVQLVQLVDCEAVRLPAAAAAAAGRRVGRAVPGHNPACAAPCGARCAERLLRRPTLRKAARRRLLVSGEALVDRAVARGKEARFAKSENDNGARRDRRTACCCAICCCQAWSFAKSSAICCWIVRRPAAAAAAALLEGGSRVLMGGGAVGSHASAAAELAPARCGSGRMASFGAPPTRGEAVPGPTVGPGASAFMGLTVTLWGGRGRGRSVRKREAGLGLCRTEGAAASGEPLVVFAGAQVLSGGVAKVSQSRGASAEREWLLAPHWIGAEKTRAAAGRRGCRRAC